MPSLVHLPMVFPVAVVPVVSSYMDYRRGRVKDRAATYLESLGYPPGFLEKIEKGQVGYKDYLTVNAFRFGLSRLPAMVAGFAVSGLAREQLRAYGYSPTFSFWGAIPIGVATALPMYYLTQRLVSDPLLRALYPSSKGSDKEKRDSD